MSAEQKEIKTLVDQTEIVSDMFVGEGIKNTARAIVEDAAQVTEGQKVLIWFDPPGVQLVKEMELACKARGAEVKFFMREFEKDADALDGLDKDGIKEMFDEEGTIATALT